MGEDSVGVSGARGGVRYLGGLDPQFRPPLNAVRPA